MKETIYTTYAPSDDKTFVMKDTWNDEGDLLKTECVGWYCGEEDEALTKRYCHGGADLVAILEATKLRDAMVKQARLERQETQSN